MMPQVGSRITDMIAQAGGVLAATLGFVMLAAWILGIPLLADFDQRWMPMAPSAALLFMLFGITVFIAARMPPQQSTAFRIGSALGLTATLIALLLFILSYQGIHPDAEHFYFAVPRTIGQVPIGHISPVTALGFLLAGLSLVAMLVSPPNRTGWAITSFCLASLLALAGIVLLLGYYFGTPLLYGGSIIPPSLPASFGLTVLGAALLNLAGPMAWAPGQKIDAATLRESIPFWLIFLLIAACLIKAGSLYYDHELKQNRDMIEHQLSGIADLKVNELRHWREERLGDATVLYGNAAFADLVRRALGSAHDTAAGEQLHTWLRQIREAYGYEEVRLIDAQGVARFSVPNVSPNAKELEAAHQSLRSGQVTLDDFHRDEAGDAPHLSLLVPILDAAAGGRPLGIVMLEIDPGRNLYPLIERWPTFSHTAETLLVRRDGNDVLYLNELRYQNHTAFTLRYPLTSTENPAVMAVLGQEGIVEGTDYRGAPVIAALRAVPGTPWFMVAQVKKDEYLAAIQVSLWLTAGLITALLLSASTALGLIWRHQRVRHYWERTHAAESLARMTQLYAALSQTNQAIVRCTSEEELFSEICKVAVQFGGMKMAWIGIIETDTKMVKSVATCGYDKNLLDDIKISVDANSRFGKGPTGIAIRENRPFWCQDYPNDPHTLPWRERAARDGIAASASLPLHRDGVVIGAFILSSAETNIFDEPVRELLVEMATDIDFALDNIQREVVRKQVEEKLLYIQEAVESSSEAIVISDDKGHLFYQNKAFADLYGYANAEEFMAVGGGTASIKSPEVAKDMNEKFIQGIPWSGELNAVHKSGRVFPVHERVDVIKDDEGNLIGFIGIISDITQRKQLETEKELYFKFFNTTTDLMCIADHNGYYKKVNAAFIQTLGYSEIELLSEPFNDFVHPDDLQRTLDSMREQKGRGFTHNFENRYRCKDGSYKWLSWSVGMDKDEATKYAVYAVAHDITERKETALINQARLRLLEFSTDHTIDELLEETLNEAESLSGSLIGFYHFLDADQQTLLLQSWSTRTKGKFCKAEGKGLHYDVTAAGVWVDCIRERKAIIHNDYALLTHRKGMPPGHASVARELVVPVFRGGNVVAILGVGNKPQDYTEKDIEAITHLADQAWDIAERKKVEAALQESESRLSTIYEDSPIGISITRVADGEIISINNTALRILGFERDEVIGRTAFDLKVATAPIHPEAPALKESNQGVKSHFEGKIRAKSGEMISIEFHGRSIDLQGTRYILSMWVELTEKKQAQEQIRKLAMAVEQSPVSIVITNLSAEIEYVNEAFVKNTGYSREEAIGQNPRILNSGDTPAETFKSVWESLSKGLPWDGEFHNRRKDGSKYIEHALITPIRQADGSITHYVAVKEDITDKRIASDTINTLAFYDTLTGLPNRRLLLDRLKQALAASYRSKKVGALLFIDLDNFKTLNDTLGHDVGDLLLQQVAQRLISSVREIDTVARFGGDEFVVMLEDLSNTVEEATTQAMIVGEKIMVTFNQIFQLDNYSHRSTPSIGITLFSEQQQNVDDLLKQADLAMYRAKASGRNTVIFFDPEMQSLVLNRAVLEEDLRAAIQTNQFLLHYQPQVIGDDRLSGAEVLLRWPHPTRGMVSPGEFISLAEETGLILPIGHWVLKTACNQLAMWASLPEFSHLTIAVNVSPSQFRQPTFIDEVLAILEQSGANPKKLKLELTEGILLHDVENVIVKMNALKAKGVGFSLDDFGTGYSSLSYLKRLPLDQLKIDQGFVRDILTDPNDAAIAKMVVALAESMGLSVIAEGVEIVAQRDFLARHGCHAYQGYLFGRPIPLVEFENYVRRDTPISNSSFV